MHEGLKDKLTRLYGRFIRIRGEPREIGLGFALGLFIGMSPSMGFQMALAIFFAALLKWNKISAAVAVWITNPVTAPLIYSMNYLIGARILGLENIFRIQSDLSLSTGVAILRKSPEIIGAMTLGGVILGIPLAVGGYGLVYFLTARYQTRIKEKLLLRKGKEKPRGRKVLKRKRGY